MPNPTVGVIVSLPKAVLNQLGMYIGYQTKSAEDIILSDETHLAWEKDLTTYHGIVNLNGQANGKRCAEGKGGEGNDKLHGEREDGFDESKDQPKTSRMRLQLAPGFKERIKNSDLPYILSNTDSDRQTESEDLITEELTAWSS